MTKTRAFKAFLLLGGLTVLGVSLYAGLVVYTLAGMGEPRPIAFDAERWKAVSRQSTDNTRYRMHRDLVRKHGLVGMTRAEVVDVLGPPTATNYFREWELVYWMGPEPGFGVDSVWLLMRLEDDRVTEYSVTTD